MEDQSIILEPHSLSSDDNDNDAAADAAAAGVEDGGDARKRRSLERLLEDAAREKADLAEAEGFVAKLQAGEGIRDYISRMWNALPCLRRKVEMTPQGWDARGWERKSRQWSEGERQAVLFVLLVWNPFHWKKFNLVDAVAVLGRAEREVMARWVRTPAYC